MIELITANYQFILELVCFVLGILSVWFARKENILVYPTGLISTVITVYLLYLTKDLGNMLVNIYFSFMSIYGWYNWKFGKSTNEEVLKITTTSLKDKFLGGALMILTCFLVYLIYNMLDYEIKYDIYLDIFTTSIFFTAMWYMANKKLESWILWIIGNTLVVPLYFYKEWYLLGFQYLIFIILAVFAFRDWKKSLDV